MDRGHDVSLEKTERVVSSIEADPRWTAIVKRDSSFDGKFYYAVKTTGVYCRPSCNARLAKPQNVVFYETSHEAELAGFRACKRCRPTDESLRHRQAETIVKACRDIEASDEPPTLAALAKSAGSSTYHFHRTFKAITGVTPKAYADAHRKKLVQSELTHGERSISEAIYEAGFNSSGRFYAKSNDMLGMTPREYKRGGKDIEIHFAVGETTLGAILVARSEKGVCAISLGDDPARLVRDLQDRFPQAVLFGGDAAFELVVAKIVGYVENPTMGLDLPLDIRGTSFQRRVWEALRLIPVGKTVCYSDVAQLLGAPSAVRAIAGACAANVLAVAIPCHRVIKSDGSISGYRWGIERKRELLRRETAATRISRDESNNAE